MKVNPIYKDIIKGYEKTREANQKSLKLRQKEIYKLIPRIKEIDRELALTGIEISKAIMQNPYNKDTLLKNLQEKNTDLTIEKIELLYTNNYPKDYLHMKYECVLCKDTGYINTKKCTCLKQKLIDSAYEGSNLKNILNIENFDNFNFNYYSNKKIDSISPKENIQIIFNRALGFTNSFNDKYANLLLYGKTGLGKTFICNCIAKELLDKGVTVLYLTSFQLFKIYEDYRFNRDEHEDIDSYIDTILNVDLLIIDDLGTEFSTSLTSTELFNTLNNRHLNKKSTLISTNLAPANIKEQYSDRIVSRIFGNYIFCKFIGDDIRILKKHKK